MDNPEVGGNRGDFGEVQNTLNSPETFNEMFDGKQGGEVDKKLGETASSEMMNEIFDGFEGQKQEEFGLPDVPEMMPAAEIKPLIADGTTEKKLGKIGVSLVGEKVDTEGIAAEVKKIKELPLYEQSAARDEASAKMIYANFGRMIGNDDIGEIQAEEQRRTA